MSPNEHANDAEGGPPGSWWWAQVPRPFRKALIALFYIAAIFGALTAALSQGAKVWPAWKEAKNAIWPEALPSKKTETPSSEPIHMAVREPPAAVIRPGVFEGYVYYEASKDGKLTDDGQLQPLNTKKMPDFWEIKVGDKFKVVSPVFVRANPNNFNEWNNTGFNTRLATLSTGDCVQVVLGER
jgi:hypothetical protein